MKKLLLLTLIITSAYAKPGFKLGGKVIGSKECKEKTMIWIAQKDKLFYQGEVPANGTFEFMVIPGTYTVEATSKDKCKDAQTVIIEDKNVANLELLLIKEKTK